MVLEAANFYDQLDELYQALNKAVREIKLIKIGSQTSIVSKIGKLRDDIEILEQPNCTLDDLHRLQFKERGMREVAPGITVRTIVVPNEDFIPDSPLYYIQSSNEYAVKINGTLIKGNILNINSNDTKNIACYCNHDKCKWGHDNDRSWSPGCWLFTRAPLSQKNRYMRHIGSADTLAGDISAATRSEKETRMRQTAHDLLIQLCIDKVDKHN